MRETPANGASHASLEAAARPPLAQADTAKTPPSRASWEQGYADRVTEAGLKHHAGLAELRVQDVNVKRARRERGVSKINAASTKHCAGRGGLREQALSWSRAKRGQQKRFTFHALRGFGAAAWAGRGKVGRCFRLAGSGGLFAGLKSPNSPFVGASRHP